ncbi:MAG: hypothetical protein Hyperionvirus21_31 [Hyperionvirus sp.]|uniref:Uncharacterized protein n=1 Tax=Hyperionvirus sp. TaxID=2487770 RepID=A0A3G5AAQ9_9VIRU|nr:MAG: hypothetical protein Hyperionvirus21_31 [Hyperionvirus sp.]
MSLSPVSVGESLDKLTVLELMYKSVGSDEKKIEIEKEIDEMSSSLAKYKSQVIFYYGQLYKTNKIIWDLCEKVMDARIPCQEYNQFSVAISENNDHRSRIKKKINFITDSSLKEQKYFGMKKIVLGPHLGLGDMFMMIGAIRYYSISYDRVITFCTGDNYWTVQKIFQDDPTIQIDIAGYDEMATLLNGKYNNYDYKVVRCGYVIAGNNNFDTHEFYTNFYLDINLDPSIRYNYFHITRDLVHEKYIFDNTVGKIDKYIFTHDKGNNPFEEYFKDKEDICIYHPNRNYYSEGHKYYHVWNGYHNNIVSYGTIIENASEIYVVDSSFWCFINFLNLKATKRVILDPKWYNIHNYPHKSERNKWTFV